MYDASTITWNNLSAMEQSQACVLLRTSMDSHPSTYQKDVEENKKISEKEW